MPIKPKKQPKDAHQDHVAPSTEEDSEQSGSKPLPKPRPPPGLLKTRQRTRLSKSVDSADALNPRRQKSAPNLSEAKSHQHSAHKKYKPKPAALVPHRESKEKEELEKIKETLQQAQRRHSVSSQREANMVGTPRGEMEKQVTWATHLPQGKRWATCGIVFQRILITEI